MNFEYIGLCGSILIVLSLTVSLKSKKGQLLMRWGNVLGSVLFVIYGLLLPAYATAITNGCAILVNLYHIRKTRKDK